MSAAVSLDALRARIRAIEGDARVERRRVTSGVELVDELVGGLPRPGILEISGPPGSGRTRLAFALVRAALAERRAVAWVDPERQLYPPALAATEPALPLERVLLVQPPAVGLSGPDASSPEVWAAEQLLRSGCFPLVVCALPDHRGAGGPGRAGGHVWARAAERGHCTAVVLTARPQRALPADVRLGTSRGQLHVLRDRGGRPGGSAPLPWPHALCPWG